MLPENELRDLLTALESDRVERTISTKNTDKFSEAICAFSNDFPNHQLPGYLIIGADDKTGKIAGVSITDELLRDLASIRNNGQILPQPALSIQKYSFDEGDLAVIKVFPSPLPPVRYKGRVWIRNGPSRAIANEAEEIRLIEKRTTNARTFDHAPAYGSTLSDLNLNTFRSTYLPAAVDADTLETNHREIRAQLASLRLYDLAQDCPTNAGLLILGANIRYYLPGAYVQYVRVTGKEISSEVLDQKEFSGELLTLMQQLDDFVQNNIQQRLVRVTPLKEEVVRSYPFPAIRELLNNAIMHRNYAFNAPIKFYEFADRIEISNPGGLYGAARPENFPHQNDYRNPVLAEAMKVLGYVNRFNRGIATATQALKDNGNPEPVFEYRQPLHFGVTIYKKELP